MANIKILSLYRRILRLHQIKLPEIPRAVGDRYVRQEFRAHLTAQPEQQHEFLIQWSEYESHLVSEADLFGVGRDLAEKEIDLLSQVQKEQLQKLYKSATAIGAEAQNNNNNKNKNKNNPPVEQPTDTK